MSAGYVDPSGSNTIVDFGITPYFQLTDTSGTIIGDGVVLVGGDVIAVDISNLAFEVPAGVLNAFIIDDISGSLTLSSLAEISGLEDLSSLPLDDLSYNVFKTFVSQSYKATIAKRITGKYFGDIGALENDTVFSGDYLVNEELINRMKTAVATAIMDQSNALLVAAEDLLRDLELSDASGDSTGRDSSHPFVAGDILLFNCLVKNGNITLFLDEVATLTDNCGGATFFDTQDGDTNGFTIGLNNFGIDIVLYTEGGEGGVVVNEDPSSNIYIYTDSPGSTRFTSSNRVYEKAGGDGTREGYVVNPADPTDTGAVLIRMALKVKADPVVEDPPAE